MQEIQVRSLGQEDPLEKEMVTHSSILTWKIPWTEEPGGLQSLGLQRVRHDCAQSTYDVLHRMFLLKDTTCFITILHSDLWSNVPTLWHSQGALTPKCCITSHPWHPYSLLPAFLPLHSLYYHLPPIYFSIHLSRVFSPLKRKLPQGSLLSFIFTAVSPAPRTLSCT